ncbi:histidine phosphatase family protein [Stappia sp. ES.058]|uniref:histidine phosphatase family protein n=1 Tax=Stappia sp. ES.058 TaxID=1881061 RepID=UPI00087C6B1D|nr:histidine phosphatase family protein [Stappia sp. ES.058]SDU46869.1 Broad specificity phosphatase PhoE [Stappia sp. ES.058]
MTVPAAGIVCDCIYLTHPQVEIDPRVPVPDWGLSKQGLWRARAGLAQAFVSQVTHVFSSAERKACETAELFAVACGLAVTVDPMMHENDRSATGFLPPQEFEQIAERFFANPDVSVCGWETARAAQRRIVSRTRAALSGVPPGSTVLFVGHGGVGTLLKCHLAGLDIDRRHDQPPGGGFCYRFARGALETGEATGMEWSPIDDDGAN